MAPIEETRLHALLCEYPVGSADRIVGAGGTAGKTWRLAIADGQYLLRLRGVRTSSQAHLEFDHSLRAHLAARGVPTAEAICTHEGARWVRRDGRVYELYPFVVGRPFNPHQAQELERAAQALAGFHRAAHDYEPPGSWGQVIAQYTSLGFSDEVSDRMDDPRLQLINLLGVRTLAETADEVALVDRCIDRVRALEDTYGGAVYDGLSGYIIHGDYTPANVVYSVDGEIAGIFDFDWSMRGARCLDVAYGLCFFATEPRDIETSNIWSLTDAADLTVGRNARFLRAYHTTWPLTADEIDTIPHAFCSLWLSKRLEGMAKVDTGERFRFFARDIERPLVWMDTHWEQLRHASFSEDWVSDESG